MISSTVNVGRSLYILLGGKRPSIFFKLEEAVTDTDRILYGLKKNQPISDRLLRNVSLDIAFKNSKGFCKDEDVAIQLHRNGTDVALTFRCPDESSITKTMPRSELEDAMRRVKAVEDAAKAVEEAAKKAATTSIGEKLKAAGATKGRDEKRAVKPDNRERISIVDLAFGFQVGRETVMAALTHLKRSIKPEHGDTVPKSWREDIGNAVEVILKEEEAKMSAGASAPGLPPGGATITVSELVERFKANHPDVSPATVRGAAVVAEIEVGEGETLPIEAIPAIEANLA